MHVIENRERHKAAEDKAEHFKVVKDADESFLTVGHFMGYYTIITVLTV